MDKDKINALMAKSMGYHFGCTEQHPDYECLMDEDHPLMQADVWKPTTDMNQAMDCAKTYLAEDVNNNLVIFDGDFYSNELSALFHVKEPALAICKAILKAKGIEIE